MFTKIFISICVILLFLMPTFSQTQPLEPGVSNTLAKWRAANYSDVRYKLNITLEKGAPLMKGDIEIRVKLTDEGAKNDLILDWRTTQFANDKDRPYANVVAVNDAPDILHSIVSEHIRIPDELLKKGENFIKIEFASPIKSSGAAVTRYVDKEDGAEYLYSLFVPSDASTAFPVFDQPDLKATFQLDLKVPYDWKAVSNSAEEDFGAEIIDDNRKPISRIFSFEITKPISPYVFAFAAGDFEEFRGEKANDNNYPPNLNESLETRAVSHSRVSTMNIYVRKSQAGKFKQHSAEVFRLNREGVKFLEDWFDYKFPFPKYDLVLIPEFPFGGMEHAGATFLREDRVIFPTEPTKNDYITRANVIFHEAAHQWFGDTVTMKWFDDLWLKEGFAEFMAYKTLEKVLPEYNAWKVFYERNKQAAYLTDVTRGTTPIYQEIPNLASAKSAYGNIVYRKAPSFLKQAEFYLGEKEFQTAVRAFLKKHEFANATWQDLVKEFETASKQDLEEWANIWVKGKGVYKVKTKWTDLLQYPNRFPINLEIENTTGEKQNYLPLKFKVLAKYADKTEEVLEVKTNGKRTFLSKEADFIMPNYQDYGYGIFLLPDKHCIDYVFENIQNEKDDFLRSMMWGSLWNSVRFYELAPEEYVRLVVKNINVEQDESTIQTLLGRVSTAINYHLTDTQAKQIAPEIEKILIDKITNSRTLGERITYYRSFLSVASTENARTVLKQIYKETLGENGGDTKMRPGTAQIGGKLVRAANPAIPLKTKDKFDIVTKLITLGDADGLKLLAELEKQYTDDAAKRYAYAARAGIPTAENKLKYWKDFTENKELSESRIESAFAVWNTPRHSELTLPYLEKSLAELPVLKRNRKIFFVNGWLAAFIGGQKSESALKTVNKFLADNPNLDVDLQRKILENSDNLERAVKIRAKYGK